VYNGCLCTDPMPTTISRQYVLCNDLILRVFPPARLVGTYSAKLLKREWGTFGIDACPTADSSVELLGFRVF
jgi:hypothetical protein